MSCEVCHRIGQIELQQNPCFVMELETGYVVFGDYQRFPDKNKLKAEILRLL